MLLTIAERFGIKGILPTEAGILKIKLIQGLHDLLGFDDAEQKKLGIAEVDGGKRLEWPPDAPTAELEIGELAHDIIRETLQKLSDSGKLGLGLISLYVKFVETPRLKVAAPPEK